MERSGVSCRRFIAHVEKLADDRTNHAFRKEIKRTFWKRKGSMDGLHDPTAGP